MEKKHYFQKGLIFTLFVTLLGTILITKDSACQRIDKIYNSVQKCQPMSYDQYHEGDIIAHTSRSRQSNLIEKVTVSPYTHMGIVLSERGNKYVLEAVGPVKYTPLKNWIDRGKERKHTVKRLKLEYQSKIPQIIGAAKRFLGKPYDSQFLPSDEKIYCSELVAKAMKEGGNIKVGEWEYFPKIIGSRIIQIGSGRVRKEIEKRWGENLPITEKAITPKSIMNSDKLENVCSDF